MKARADMTPQTHLKSILLITMATLAITVAACTTGSADGDVEGCQSDAQCPTNFICNVDTGQCLCAEDDACDANEFCNDQGRCQAQAGCLTTDDCRDEENPFDICDTLTNTCVTLDAQSLQCVLSSHCPFGTTCINNICTPGCVENGDCPLGQPCINNQCDGRSNACTDNSFCEYGQLCDLDTSTCEDHRLRDTLCNNCEIGILGFEGCDASVDGCLIDSTVLPNSCSTDFDCDEVESQCYKEDPFAATGFCVRLFCGTDQCDDATDPCPRGYTCNVINTVTGTPCTPENDTCTDGRACSFGGEGVEQGYCSCIADTDCPNGNTCVDPGPNGRCISGSSCGPVQGLTCQDLR